jgi:hypothetical protein
MELWDGESMDPELERLLERMPTTEKETSRILNGWDDVRALIGGIARSLRVHHRSAPPPAIAPGADADDGND